MIKKFLTKKSKIRIYIIYSIMAFLRWNYPDQVKRVDEKVISQPWGTPSNFI